MATETERSLIKQLLGNAGGGTAPSPVDAPALDYRAIARQAAVTAGIDPDLFDSLVRNESGYDPNALSPAGAIGLTQLMPETAAELGVDPHDPVQNVHGGAFYLRKMLERYRGDTTKALAGYNFGPGNVDSGKPWPKETQDYVRRVQGGRQPYKPSPLPPPTQAVNGPPQDGIPDWVPAGLDPLARRMIARLGPPPAPPPGGPFTGETDFSNASMPPESAPEAAPAPPQPHTIGDRIMSAAYSFGQGVKDVPAGLLDSMAIISKHANAMFGEHKELDEYASSYISKQIKDAANFYFPQDKILQGEFLSQMLPNALGQGAGFIVGGALTGGSYAFPAVAGAAIGGAQGYQEAQAMGAGPDQQLYSYLLNAGIGTSEAIPIGHLLEGLDKGTGGVFKRALIEAGKQTFEEGIQEAVQQTGSNVVAKWLYDNQRDLMSQVFVSGQVGGAAGAIQGFITTLVANALGVRARNLGGLDQKLRQHTIDEEETPGAPEVPGKVTPQLPSGEPMPMPKAPTQPTEALGSPVVPQPELPPDVIPGVELPPPPPVGPMAEEQRLPPLEPVGRWTTEQMEEARGHIPWISEGEIQSSSDLPALIEVAKRRIQAYKEGVLTSQATDEELRLLNTPGAPRLLILKLIEDRLAQRVPIGPAPTALPSEEPPPEKLPPITPSVRPVMEEPVYRDTSQEQTGPVSENQYQEALNTLRGFFGGVPSEGQGVPGAELGQGLPTTIPGAAGAETLTPGLPGSLTVPSPQMPSVSPSVEPTPTSTSPPAISIPSPVPGVEQIEPRSTTETTPSPLPSPGSVEDVTEPSTPEVDQEKEDYLTKVTDELLGETSRPFERAVGEGGVGFEDLVAQIGPDRALEVLRSPLNQSYKFKLVRKGKTSLGLDVLAEIIEREGAQLPETGSRESAAAEWLHSKVREREHVRGLVLKEWDRLTGEGGEGGGPDETFGFAAPEAPAEADPFSAAPTEIRQAILQAGIYHYFRGAKTEQALSEEMAKALGPGVKPYVAGLFKKLSSLSTFTRKEAPVVRGQAAGPAVPAGKKEGGGPAVGPTPKRAGPTEPVKEPAKPEVKAAPKPSAPKGPPAITREIREGGVATLSRELLPKLDPNEITKTFPAHELKVFTEKVGKKPLPHQLENAVRTLKAFGWDLVDGIPDGRKDNTYHSFLIADGTGTGKTLSAGLVLSKFFERNPKANILVIVKNEDLAKQWVSDVAGPMGLKDTLVSRINPLKAGATRTVHFMTYKRMELAWSEKTMPEIEKFAPDLLLLDESQALKNWVPGTKDQQGVVKTAAACEAATRFSKNTLFMSATPFESVLHTGYLTTTKLWYPKKEWKQWLQDSLGLKFKDGYWTGLSPKNLAKFHRILISTGRMTKSEIDFSKLENSQGKKITLTTENIKVAPSEEQAAEYGRIGRIFNDLLEDPELKRSFYKLRLVKSIRYLVYRALDEENKLPRAIELGNQARAEGKTVVFTLFRKNNTDLEEWWNNVLAGKKAGGQKGGYGEKSFMPQLIQHLAANRINIKSPVKVLQKAFPDFVPITGDEPSGGAVRQSNLQRLMKGEAPGAILTMAAGGTGLSAHDTIGKFPRVQINVSVPDTAGTMIQVAGRTFRLGSESSAKMFWLFGNSPSEGSLAGKIAWRLREMGALVMGKEENPTADEIEQFDFPEDPAGEAEELAAVMAFTGEEEDTRPVAPAVFIGFQDMPKGPPVELYNLTEEILGRGKGFTVSRQTLEEGGYQVPPAAPQEQTTEMAVERRGGEILTKAPPGTRELEFLDTGELKEGPLKTGQILWTDRGVLKTGAFVGQAPGPGNSVLLAVADTETGKTRYFQVREGETRIMVRPKAEQETAPLAPPPRSDEAANYGFIPSIHREPNPEGTITNLKSMRDMIRDLEQALSTRHAVGWFRPGGKGAKWVLAHFEIWRNIIRSRIYHDVEVFSHEGGHRLDQLMFPQHPSKGLGAATDPQIQQFKGELLKIATAAKPGQSKVSEGFAEFVRFYLTNDEQARKVAPNFYPWFENALKTRLPDVYTAFQGMKADWENMMNADPVAAIEMTIMSGAIKGNRIPKDFYPHQWYEAVVNEMAVVKNGTDWLLEQDGKRDLPADLDPRVLSQTYVAWADWVEGWVKHGQYSWTNPDQKIGPSLLQIYKPVGKKIKQYNAYTKAVEAIHDLETKGWDPWERYGIYESHARETIKRLAPKYEAVRKQEVQFFSNIVDVWVQAGLMSEELAKKMRSKNGIYSPMFRVMIDRALEDFDTPGGAGKRFGNLPKVTMMRRGSRLETIPSIEAAYKMLMVTFKRAEENATAARFAELAESVPNGGRDVAAKVPSPLMPITVSPREVLSKMGLPQEVLDEIDPEVLNKVIEIFRPSPFKPRAPYMYVWQKGEKVYYEWDPEIYKALNFLGRHDMGVLDKVLSPFVDALRAGAITLSPSFHLRSAIKDPWTGLFQSKNPVLHAAYWIPSLVSSLTHGESYRRYKRAMGGVSTFLGIQPEDVAKLADRDIQRRYGPGNYWANPKNWAHELFGTMSYLGLALEYMPRIAEARVHGLMEAKTRAEFLKAGFAGRNATVDFNMMGGLSRSLTRSAAFFGVGTSGIARMMREFKTKPFAAMVKFSIFGLLPVLYYYKYVRDDDRWKRIPQKDRDQNFIFWLPGMDEPRRIPKPHEWGTLMTVVERMLQYQDSKDPRIFKEFGFSTLRNLPNPVPTGVMLGWELAANYSQHLGRPISPSRGEPGEQYWNYTTETAKGIGRLLQMSPAKIEYALRQVTGGLYNRVVPSIEEKLGVKEKRKGLPSESDEPIIGTLTYRYPAQATENQNRFYDDYWVPASKVYESFTGKRSREPEDLSRYLGKSSQYLATYYALKGIEQALTTMRTARDLIATSSTLSDADKRQKLERLSAQMDGLAAKGVAIGKSILGHKPQAPQSVAPGVH